MTVTSYSSKSFHVPVRTSSKRREETLFELENTRDEIKSRLKEVRKKLKARGSLNFAYWDDRKSIVSQEWRHIQVQRRISLKLFCQRGGKEEQWLGTEVARQFLEKEKVCELAGKLFQKQAVRLKSGKPTSSLTRFAQDNFMEMFTKASVGLYVGGISRETIDESNFRKKTITAYNATRPHPTNKDLWCPILQLYAPASAMTATHIFSYSHGQKLMNAIYGTENENEICSPFNGLLLVTEVEEMFDRGYIVIVPLVENESSEHALQNWHASEPKRYKVRIVDPEAKKMQESPPLSLDKRWRDLDHQELAFLGDHRPRARYIYFHYCVTMLRRSHHQSEHTKILRDELGKKFWSAPGPYLRRKFLLAFVEEMGHAELLEGAHQVDDEDQEPDDLVLATANEAIGISARNDSEIDEEDDEDYDEDYDEEDE